MRKIQMVLAGSLSLSTLAFAPSVMAQYNMMPPGQYNMMPPGQQPGMTGQPIQTQTPPVTMGPRIRLNAPPQLQGLSGYENLGSFVSGSSFPSCSTGPVNLVFLVTTQEMQSAQNAFQNLLNSNGWTPSTPTGTNALSGTQGNTTCQVSLDNAFGNDKVRIYIDYRVNNNPPPQQGMGGQYGSPQYGNPNQTGLLYGGGGCGSGGCGAGYGSGAAGYGPGPTQYNYGCGSGTTQYGFNQTNFGSTPGLVPNGMQSQYGLTPGMVPSGAGANQGMMRR